MMLALLPESVKLLALKARPGSDERIARILARLQPDLAIEPGTRFTTGNPQQAHHGKRFTPPSSSAATSWASHHCCGWSTCSPRR